MPNFENTKLGQILCCFSFSAALYVHLLLRSDAGAQVHRELLRVSKYLEFKYTRRTKMDRMTKSSAALQGMAPAAKVALGLLITYLTLGATFGIYAATYHAELRGGTPTPKKKTTARPPAPPSS